MAFVRRDQRRLDELGDLQIVVVPQMDLHAVDVRGAELVRHHVADHDGEVRGNGLPRLRASPPFAQHDGLIEAFELDLRLEQHRALARGALRVGHDAVRGHGHDQRRELGMANDVHVIVAQRTGAVDGDVDRDHVRGVADRSHDSAGAVLLERADHFAAVGELE